MGKTTLDAAHAAMEAVPEDDRARLRFYEHLAGTEVFLMLDSEPEEDEDIVSPAVFEHDGVQYVLVFDREDRLSAFSDQVTPYVALSGRSVAGMLTRQDIGLAVNLGVAPSSILLPPDAVDWLSSLLDHVPDEIEARITEVSAPNGLPESLVQAIDTKLATATGLAAEAYLVAVTFQKGARGHLLAFVDALPGAEHALKQAASEALVFSDIEAGEMDVAFLRSADKIVDRLARVGLRFDLPQLQDPVSPQTTAPGSDPDKPPRLK